MTTSTKIEQSIKIPKLELKHLAPYLSYGLKIKTHYGIRLLDSEYNDDKTIGLYGTIRTQETSKPILRPLSDITYEVLEQFYEGRTDTKIIVSDYKSEVSNALTFTVSFSMMGEPYTDIIINRNSIEFTNYWIVEKLLMMHYDIFGLIEKGLAINKNTIKQ